MGAWCACRTEDQPTAHGAGLPRTPAMRAPRRRGRGSRESGNPSGWRHSILLCPVGQSLQPLGGVILRPLPADIQGGQHFRSLCTGMLHLHTGNMVTLLVREPVDEPAICVLLKSSRYPESFLIRESSPHRHSIDDAGSDEHPSAIETDSPLIGLDCTPKILVVLGIFSLCVTGNDFHYITSSPSLHANSSRGRRYSLFRPSSNLICSTSVLRQNDSYS